MARVRRLEECVNITFLNVLHTAGELPTSGQRE